MKKNDKSIKVSEVTYKLLLTIKKQTGKPIKRIVSDVLVESVFNKIKREK